LVEIDALESSCDEVSVSGLFLVKITIALIKDFNVDNIGKRKEKESGTNYETQGLLI
jgi:hypothetical protein